MSGDTAMDADVLCKCNVFTEDSKFLLQSSDLIPSDFLYDVAQGRTPFFFRSLPDPTGTSC